MYAIVVAGAVMCAVKNKIINKMLNKINSESILNYGKRFH